MKSLFASRPGRAFVAALLMLSWLVLSNHCALGLMAGSPAAAHAGCCGSASPDQGSEPAAPPVRECCQSMQAVPPAVPWAVAPAELLSAPVAWMLSNSETAETFARGEATGVLETGPPEARSFAELVLRHGVRSHAPPVNARS